MGLLDCEIIDLKQQLGYHLLDSGSEPYITYEPIFKNVVAKWLYSAPITKSSTTVVIQTPAYPADYTLTIVDPTGLVEHQSVYVDLGFFQEKTMIKNMVGNAITVTLSKPHSGTYPVIVEGGESKVRELLRKLTYLDSFDGALFSAAQSAGIKKVDEVEFQEARTYLGQKSRIQEIEYLIRKYRIELAHAVGVPCFWGYEEGGFSFVLY